MSVIRRILSISTSVLLLAGPVLAQNAAGQRGETGPAVAASSTASGVRFVAPGEARRVRLEVYTAAGERLFDSGFRAGGILDWDGQGLVDGSYLCVLTAEDLGGHTSRKLSSVTVASGRAALGKEGEEQLKVSYAQAIAAAGIGQDEVSAAGRAKKSSAVTVTAHDGTDGQVTSTTGALTFRTGDLFSAKEQEQMRVTPEGRVGIGTTNPEDTLDVNGIIRARGGIRFDDGTVLTSAGGLNKSGLNVSSTSIITPNASAATGDGTTAAAMSGTGTTNKLTKWLDGAGTVGDSSILETNGLTVFGRSTPLLPNASDFHLVEMAAPGTKTPLTLVGGSGSMEFWKDTAGTGGTPTNAMAVGMGVPGSAATNDIVFSTYATATGWGERLRVTQSGDLKMTGVGKGIIFPDGSKQTSAAASIAGQNAWTGQNTFVNGLSANGTNITNVANPVSATDAVNKAYTDANFVKFVPGAEQLSVGDANGTAPMINLRGGSTCCSGPGGHTPAWFKVFQNGSFVATGNLGIGVSPMQGKGYRTSWDSYKGAFRSGYADAEWDDANVGFFSWAGGSNSTAIGLYALAFGDTNSAESTSSIVFGSGNQVKGAAGFSAGAGNRVCDTYGVAFGNKAQSGGPLINGKCDPDSFNLRGLAAVAIGYNVTADQDHTTAMGKFASNNGFSGTFIWSDGSATASADTFRNTANNEFAARATGGFRFRTNLTGTTGCNLPAGSGVFNCTSSRTTKENFSLVDGGDVLARLRKVPVSTWNYIAEGQQSRHLGPMAEDFYGAFGLGTSDRAIGIQDAVGVSLAAVKALDARTLELQQKSAEVEQLRAKVGTLEQRLAALEQLMQKQAESQQK
jgi:hypothetical protein